MKRISPIRLALAALALVWSEAALADGLVVVRPQPGLPQPTQLAVKYHHVDIAIRDQVARVEIDQVFHNLNGRDVEGEYIFPIPDGAAVSDFVLYVDGEAVHAEAMDAKQALRIYEDLVRQSRDPALLEYAGREMFRARVFPFPAHGDRRVALEYDHLVERTGGLYRFVYPLSTERFSSRPLENAYVMIELEADRPIRNAYCPSHDVEIEYLGRQRVRLSWEESGTKPDRDLVFFYSLAEGAMDMRLVPYRPERGDDGYFMLLASMGADDRIPVTPKDVVFVIDRSGSMRGDKIEQARDALVYCLKNLNDDDRFNIVDFASSVDAFDTDLRDVSRREIADAVDYVQSLRAGGGTNISGALERALGAHFAAERPAFLVFLTDGLPTAGVTDPEKILDIVADHNERRRPRRERRPERASLRIFPFGVGYDVNAVLLDELAAASAGAPSYVRPSEDLQTRIETFYDQIAHPVMTDLELEIDGARLRDLQPSTLPDIFRGGQLVVFGRYRGAGQVDITLSGVVDGKRRSYDLTADLPRRERHNAFVGRLWATRRVGTLLRSIRLHGEERELVEEVKRLGLEFGVVTPYTSFLVDEDQDVVAHEPPVIRERGAASWGRITRLYRGREDAGGSASAIEVPSSDGSAGAPAAPSLSLQAATGAQGFEISKKVEEMAYADVERETVSRMKVRHLEGRTYLKEGEIWKDTACPEKVKATVVKVGSDTYFELLADHPELGPVLALGEQVIFEVDGRWYQTAPDS